MDPTQASLSVHTGVATADGLLHVELGKKELSTSL
jgi:hypothetical protein